VEDALEGTLTKAGPPDPGQLEAQCEWQCRLAHSADHHHRLPARPCPGDPRGGDQDDLLDPLRIGDRDLGRDEAAHRIADQDAALDP
jgi:hypothetical protein